jgi:hypothetical protein
MGRRYRSAECDVNSHPRLHAKVSDVAAVPPSFLLWRSQTIGMKSLMQS